MAKAKPSAADLLAERDRTILELRSRVDMLEGLFSRIVSGAPVVSAPSSKITDKDGAIMRSLTMRQHAVAQMVTRGATNSEVAKRMGLTENGAKSHVRYVMLKLGATNRVGIASAYRSLVERMSPDEYKMLAELPIDWDEKWTAGDPYTKQMRG